ncbi:MAG: hypothetical protein EZS28_032693 [Streblomastix strix]|uniref:Tyr recombinase domain-containing protein n=1 Tax=Streblomastix strix TaxID=222440 RepID=A0A5J4UP71_9EUKA|nr:MAG: hypothetical protein EZS28_032693 [Streblomastix strix]
MGFNNGERTGNDSNGSWNLEQKISENLRVQSLAIRSDNSTAVFDFRKWRASTSLIKEIKQVHQTIEKLGIQIQITHLPGVRNEIADALSRLSRAGDYKLMENIFKQICLQMNLNPIIDLFSQHFNNLLPRFMSTIRGHGETAIDALNQTQKKELPCIHPPIPLLPAVLKKIREEQIGAMIKAPLWRGQIQYAELVNENAQSIMLGWINEILEPGTSLIKKNLKLQPGKICCFLMDVGQEGKKICEKDLRLQPKTKSGLHSYKLPKNKDRIVCPRATFFDWLKRIDNKHGRSIRDNKYGALWWNEDITIPAKRGQISLRLKKLLDLMGMKGKQVYSFRHSAATQLVIMGLDETLLNTYTGHARNSKSTNEYYIFAERLKDNEIATKLSDTRGQVECNPISSTQQR